MSPEAAKRQKLADIKRAQNKLEKIVEDDMAHEPDTLFIPIGKASSNKQTPTSGTSRPVRKARGSIEKPSQDDLDESSSISQKAPHLAPTVQRDDTVLPDAVTPSPKKSSTKPVEAVEKPKAASTSRPPSKATRADGKKVDVSGTSTGPSTSRKAETYIMDDSYMTEEPQKDDKEKVPRPRPNMSAPKSQVHKSKKQQPLGEYDGKILVAIDLYLIGNYGLIESSGTTYSGLCWAQTRLPDIQTPIKLWPNPVSRGLEGYNWGFLIPPDAKRQTWFKLELDPDYSRINSALAQDFPDDRAAPPCYDRNPEILVQDYLTALREHFEAVLKNTLPATVATTIPVEYIITVPAVWSATAIAKTRTCAEKAGMGEGTALKIVSEPEAAAVYALQHMSVYDLEKGDVFVVCDAGGGTVDLVSYRIMALKPVLKVVEVTPGKGGLCGSTFLNRRFTAFLRQKLGTHPEFRENMLEEAIKKFENEIKPQFTGSNDEEYDVL
ncbi:MAG: hypothetical protein Q9198_009511, partial [Flavoplaca austrocitrina]